MLFGGAVPGDGAGELVGMQLGVLGVRAQLLWGVLFAALFVGCC